MKALVCFGCCLSVGLSVAADRFEHVFAWTRVTDEASARAYAEIGVTDIPAMGTNGFAAVRKYGMRAYCCFAPPVGSPQVMRPEEQKIFDYISAADLKGTVSNSVLRQVKDERRTAARCQFGGEPVVPTDVCPERISCFLSDENCALAKAQLTKTLKENPLAGGICFDFIGYMNLHSCECNACKRRLGDWLKRQGMQGTEASRNRFFRESLVSYINTLVDYVKSGRPNFKVAMHLYPAFLPDPLYGGDLKADFVHETVAWYFPWPKEKIAAYTRRILAAEHQPGSVSIPFVGLNSKKGGALAYKSPERLEEELKLILANGGRSLSVCNGPDMLDPGYREVFLRHTRSMPTQP